MTRDTGRPPSVRPLADRRGHWRVTAAAGALTGALVCGAGGWFAASQMRDPRASALLHAPSEEAITVPVERRVLRSRIVARADIGYSMSTELSITSDLTDPVVTTAPPSAGRPVHEGDVLVGIEGRPTFLLTGQLPLYRDLIPGTTGDDVVQFRDALSRLGFPSNDPGGTYGPDTERAVRDFYGSRGFAPAPAPSDLVAGAQQATDAATTAHEDLDQAIAQTGLLPPSASDAERIAARNAVAQATRRWQGATAELALAQQAVGVRVPRSEVVFTDHLPLTVTRVLARRGGVVKGPIIEVSGGDLIADSTISSTDQSLAHLGAPATLIDDTSGRRFAATIAGIRTVKASRGAGQVHLHLAIIHPDPGLAGANLRVVIDRDGSAAPVLVVPVAALYGGADGTSKVQVWRAGAARSVSVRVGRIVAGEAEIQGLGHRVSAHDRVVVGRSPVTARKPGGTR